MCAKINSNPLGRLGNPSEALASEIGVGLSDLSHFAAGRLSRIAVRKVNKIRDFIDNRRSHTLRVLAYLADGNVLTRYEATVRGYGLNLWERVREIEGKGRVKLRHNGEVYKFRVEHGEKKGSAMTHYYMTIDECKRAKQFLNLLRDK